jgi:hypothetical protein
MSCSAWPSRSTWRLHVGVDARGPGEGGALEAALLDVVEVLVRRWICVIYAALHKNDWAAADGFLHPRVRDTFLPVHAPVGKSGPAAAGSGFLGQAFRWVSGGSRRRGRRGGRRHRFANAWGRLQGLRCPPRPGQGLHARSSELFGLERARASCAVLDGAPTEPAAIRISLAGSRPRQPHFVCSIIYGWPR